MLAARIVGAETVVSQMTALPGKAHNRVKDQISRLTMELLTKVKSEKLSGQVLHNVTGNLRASINQRVQDLGQSIVGAVGTNLVYARAHEFGVDQFKEVTVKAYLRTITSAFGKQLLTPVTFEVGSFSRNQHTKLPERSFLRSALDEMRPQVRQELLDALREATW